MTITQINTTGNFDSWDAARLKEWYSLNK